MSNARLIHVDTIGHNSTKSQVAKQHKAPKKQDKELRLSSPLNFYPLFTDFF